MFLIILLQDLETNVVPPTDNIGDYQFQFFDKPISGQNSNELHVTKGEMFGEFNLGSTVVLIFEAPENFDFKVEGAEKVKLGQAIGHTA